jgi:hypothetical protein
MKALTAWAKCVRDTYGIMAKFTHVDKDMAEIGMLKDVWNAKISLCWWHLRRAVRTRLASAKLSTTPYDPGRAHAEFSFIDVVFVPAGQADGEEYGGGVPDSITPVVPASQPQTMTMANGLRITIPARQALATVRLNGQAAPRVEGTGTLQAVSTTEASAESAPQVQAGSATIVHVQSTASECVESTMEMHLEGKENEGGDTHDAVRTRSGRVIKPTRNTGEEADPQIVARLVKARLPRTAAAPKVAKAVRGKTDEAEASSSEDEAKEGQKKARRTFCPTSYRDAIVNMMEKHYCAHPLLPGYAHPSAEGIKRWAVTQMYKFCVEHGLPEVWVYLWENWYRRSRWELWARSVHPEIPVLKTTMILETQ